MWTSKFKTNPVQYVEVFVNVLDLDDLDHLVLEHLSATIRPVTNCPLSIARSAMSRRQATTLAILRARAAR